MSDRTFRLILDGKKGGLVKGSSPSSAAKKACKKLSAETGKSSFKFELQETTKDSKKKVYGPYKIKVKMAGGVRSPFSVLSNHSKETRTSLPPFVANGLNDDLPNHVNFNYNFSGVNKSDLVKQLNTLIKIQQKILMLHEEFGIALSNKKQSVIKRLGELSKNSKPLSNITTLPSLRNIIPNKTYKSKINFANYNLQESIAKGDIEEKFWELNHYFASISDLISKIQAKLSSSH
jgi:hypothetical protein